MTTFFFDNCVPPRIGRALRELGKDIEILQEVFKRPDVPDLEWMAAVEKHQWIVLTEDNRIRRNQVERGALKDSTLRMVFLPEPFGTIDLWAKVIKIVQWWPAIEKNCKNLAPGTRLLMKMKTGKLEVLEK